MRHGACGILGGQDGAPHRYELHSGGTVRAIRTKEVGLPIKPGDVFLIQSGGGGGWGDPARRAEDSRAQDRTSGFVGG